MTDIALDEKALEAACAVTVLGEDADGKPVHLEPQEAATAIRAYLRVSPSQGEGPAADVVEALRGAKVIIEMMERPAGLGAEVEAALDRRLAAINAILASLAPRAAQESPADEQSGETLSTWKLPPYDAPPKTVVDEQAEDESLWFKAETITENILQKALRRLHASVEAAALAAEPGEAINRLRAGTQEGWRQKIEEIRARVERTICPTFSSDSGDIGEQGRISREDFDTLVISALGNAAPSPEAKGGRS